MQIRKYITKLPIYIPKKLGYSNINKMKVMKNFKIGNLGVISYLIKWNNIMKHITTDTVESKVMIRLGYVLN